MLTNIGVGPETLKELDAIALNDPATVKRAIVSAGMRHHDGPAARSVGPISTSFSNPMAGVVQFNVSVKVDMAELSGWKPDRIAAFFAGIAQVLSAKGAIEERASST